MPVPVVATVYPIAERNNIPFKTDIDPALGMCDADPNWLQAALINFLENAVEACIHDRTKSEHHVWFQARPKGTDQICFEVTDNGTGMDQETQEKMFTLFFLLQGIQGYRSGDVYRQPCDYPTRRTDPGNIESGRRHPFFNLPAPPSTG